MARGNRDRREGPGPSPPRRKRLRPSAKGIALVLGSAVLAYGAASSAAVNVLHTKVPALALRIDAQDPVALVRDAQIRADAAGMAEVGNASIAAVVQRSVRALPLNGPAFRLHALSSVAGADLTKVRARMSLSNRMERRDPGVQLWLIEDAVARNDIAGALGHYDTALRIAESSRAILFPVLTRALEKPRIRARFVPFMLDPPPWLEGFLRFAVSNSRDPVAIAELARAAGGFPAGPAFATRDTELLRRLLSAGEFEAAIAHYRRIPGADPGVLTSLALTRSGTDFRFQPVSWQPFEIEGIEPYLLAAQDGDGIEIEAELAAGYKGPFARKYLALPAGEYRLEARMRSDGFTAAGRVRWVMTCTGEALGAPILQAEGAVEEAFVVSAPVAVPRDCPVQALQIDAESRVPTGFARLALSSARLVPGPVTEAPLAGPAAGRN